MEIVLKEEAYHLFSSLLTLSKVIFLCVCVCGLLIYTIYICLFCASQDSVLFTFICKYVNFASE